MNPAMPIEPVLLFATGFATWSFMEYVLHRWAMHERFGRGVMSREHLKHHSRSNWYFNGGSVASWAGVGLVGAAIFAPVGWFIAGLPGAIAAGSGWASGYGYYEWHHARAHRVAPGNWYQRWLRLHHFHHHYGHPLCNHGVSFSIWDHVFGTYEKVEGPIRVPRRLAMPWLLDVHDEIKPEYRADYVIVGRPGVAGSDVDLERAFANLVPLD